jgi:hypothetical protein
MFNYIRDYILAPPSEIPKKKHRLVKLRTFSSKPAIPRAQKSKMKQITNIATNAMRLLQSHGIMAQTSDYPLAMANLDGTMRKANKAEFRSSLCKHTEFTGAFITTSPTLCNTFIIDFLYFIHIPPPPDVANYSTYFSYLWERAIDKLGIKRGFNCIYIVFDKPDFLPPPRTLVHQSRAEKVGKLNDQPYPIADNQEIPHNGFTALLSLKEYKADLVQYISFKLTSKSVLTSGVEEITFIIDSPSAPSPFLITQGSIQQHPPPSPPNQHGEADYAVWHHTIHSPSRNIVIFSGDTDTWVYGLGLCELGWLEGKSVFVQ